MGKKERDLINKRLLSLKPNERLFRANSGMAWIGVIITIADIIKQKWSISKIISMIKTKQIIILFRPRPFHGFQKGCSDLVGFTEIKITADMVGKNIAVFTGEEVKATGDLSDDQKRWRDLIVNHGGIWRKVTD